MDRLLATLAVAAVLLTILVLARAFVRHRFDVMFLTLLMLGYWFVARPVQILLGLDQPTPDYLFPVGGYDVMVLAQGAALLWLAGLAVGIYAADVAGQPAMGLFPRLRGEPPPAYVLMGLLAVTALGVAVTAWLMTVSGGTLTDSVRFVKSEKAVTGFYFLRQFAAVGELLSVFAFFYFIYLGRVRSVRVPRWWLWLALLCFGVNAFGVYAWGQRYAIAMASLGFVAGYHYFIRRLTWTEMALAAAAFLAIFVGLRLVRDDLFFGEAATTPMEAGNLWRKIAISMHGAQYDALMLAIRDYDLTAGLRWGEDFRAGLAAMIPRQIWPDRAAFNPGVWFRQIYEPGTVNGWPITPIGEWLVNFGWLGVAAGGALSGYLLRAAQRVYDDLWRNPWSMVLATAAALFVLPGGVTAGSAQAMIATIVPLFLAALAMRQLATPGRSWG